MSIEVTDVLSVAVQLIFCEELTTQDSPPLGLTTVTEGAWLSIGTVPAGPAAAASGLLSQSRSLTDVTVMLPVPPGAELVTATLNRFPVVPVGPQLVVASS